MVSKRRMLRKACTGKKAYETRQEASAAWYSLVRREDKSGVNRRLVIYSCQWCGKYHLGHENARREQARKAAMRR